MMKSPKAEWNGLLLVDKPEGMTSHDVVDEVRHLLGQRSVGHTGTLDPIATGLLVLVLGQATKLSDYLMATTKSYWLKIRLGVTTDTYDRSGKVMATSPVSLLPEDVQAKISVLQGTFDWPVPMYSAVKVHGHKLYELARQGQTAEVPIKQMSFFDVHIEDLVLPDVSLRMHCSKGSYLRTWCHELGKTLGCGATLQELRRLTVGQFNIDQAATLGQLAEWNQGSSVSPLSPPPGFVPMSQSLNDWRALIVQERDERLLRNGQVPRDVANRLIVEIKQSLQSQKPVGVRILDGRGELLGLLEAHPQEGLKIRRVFKV